MVDGRILTAALVLLAVIAFGVAAGGVGSVDIEGSDKTTVTATPTSTLTQPQVTVERRTRVVNRTSSSFELWCPAPLSRPALFGVTLLALLAIGGLWIHRTQYALVPALVVTPTVLYLVTACGVDLPSIGPMLVDIGGIIGSIFSEPLGLAGALLFALLGALVFAHVRSARAKLSDRYETGPDRDSHDLGAIGEAAGAAAERIEGDADVSNEVFRAWVEMTRHLEVDHPDATTPEEFAESATAAGMAESDVETLTRLFQDVRYGGADADANASQAVAALRRIERAYGGERS